MRGLQESHLRGRESINVKKGRDSGKQINVKKKVREDLVSKLITKSPLGNNFNSNLRVSIHSDSKERDF